MQTRTSTANVLSVLDETPFGRHVKPFVDQNGKFSPTTVSAELEKCHEPHSTAKGTVIATFNASHSEGTFLCPFRKSASALPDKDLGYAKFMHLGTTRIWKADGMIDEIRWKKFVDFVTGGQLGHNK